MYQDSQIFFFYFVGGSIQIKGSGDAEVSSSGANLQIKMSLGLYQGRPTFSVVEDPELHLSDFKIKVFFLHIF